MAISTHAHFTRTPSSPIRRTRCVQSPLHLPKYRFTRYTDYVAYRARCLRVVICVDRWLFVRLIFGSYGTAITYSYVCPLLFCCVDVQGRLTDDLFTIWLILLIIIAPYSHPIPTHIIYFIDVLIDVLYCWLYCIWWPLLHTNANTDAIDIDVGYCKRVQYYIVYYWHSWWWWWYCVIVRRPLFTFIAPVLFITVEGGNYCVWWFVLVELIVRYTWFNLHSTIPHWFIWNYTHALHTVIVTAHFTHYTITFTLPTHRTFYILRTLHLRCYCCYSVTPRYTFDLFLFTEFVLLRLFCYFVLTLLLLPVVWVITLHTASGGSSPVLLRSRCRVLFWILHLVPVRYLLSCRTFTVLPHVPVLHLVPFRTRSALFSFTAIPARVRALFVTYCVTGVRGGTLPHRSVRVRFNSRTAFVTAFTVRARAVLLIHLFVIPAFSLRSSTRIYLTHFVPLVTITLSTPTRTTHFAPLPHYLYLRYCITHEHCTLLHLFPGYHIDLVITIVYTFVIHRITFSCVLILPPCDDDDVNYILDIIVLCRPCVLYLWCDGNSLFVSVIDDVVVMVGGVLFVSVCVTVWLCVYCVFLLLVWLTAHIIISIILSITPREVFDIHCPHFIIEGIDEGGYLHYYLYTLSTMREEVVVCHLLCVWYWCVCVVCWCVVVHCVCGNITM